MVKEVFSSVLLMLSLEFMKVTGLLNSTIILLTTETLNYYLLWLTSHSHFWNSRKTLKSAFKKINFIEAYFTPKIAYIVYVQYSELWQMLISM